MRYYCFYFLITFLIAVNIWADDHSNARTIGMSRAGMVTSFGIDAYGINPANFDYHPSLQPVKDNKLKQPKRLSWEITLFSVGGGYGSDSSIDFYNKYLKYLSVNRTTFTNIFTDLPSVLYFRSNVLPATQTWVNYDFDLKWLSVNISTAKAGTFNFSMSDRVGLNTNAYSRDQEMPLTFVYTPHLANGTYDLTNVFLNQSEATAWWLRKYSLGYAKQFDFGPKSGIRNISFGFSASLVHGFGSIITYNSTLLMNSYGVKKNSNNVNHVDSISGEKGFYTLSSLTDFFTDYKDGARTHYDFFPKPAGTGYSFDLGMAMQIGDQWRLALSVTDIGQVNWTYRTFINKNYGQFIYRNFDLSSSDPTYNAFVNDLEGLSTRDSTTGYSTNMPTKYRGGISFQPSKKLIIECDYLKGDNDMPGNSSAGIVSIGGEYFPIPILPLRTGFSYGGPGTYYIAVGAGLKLRNFSLDIATNGVNQLIANKRFSVAISAKAMF